MMAAEADSRGFYLATKRAFVCDGLPYNWTIQQTYFPTFTPILDVVHVLEHVYAAARCVRNDPRKIIAAVIGYFENNARRMNYPAYRRDGLPVTSALMESFVKELNHRVKGTEKFWNDGPSGEAILQVRAAVLCDDDRLQRHLKNRPGNPFCPNAHPRPPAAANAG